MTPILISKPPRQVANILKGRQNLVISKNAPKEWLDYMSGKTKEKPKPSTGYLYCTKEPPFLDVAEPYDYDGMMYIGREYILFEKSKRMRKPSVPMYVDLGDGEYELDNLWEEYSHNEDLKEIERERKDGSIYGEHYRNLNGKVVAKFSLNKVELLYWGQDPYIYDECVLVTDSLDDCELEQRSCLKTDELQDYIGYELEDCGYAWHISNLQVFDKPKNLWEFEHAGGFMSVKDCPKKEKGICNMGYGARGYSGCDRARLKRPPQSWCYVEELR